MTPIALAMVLAAACAHAAWNLIVKRVDGGIAFVSLFVSISVVAYLPLAVVTVLVTRPRIGGAEIAFMAGNSILHVGYFLALQRGYRASDLSLVYPLARGTGPLLATVLAIVVLHERPTPLALAGAGLIALGILLVAGPGRWKGDAAGIGYGLLTGALIGVYTLWDAYAVTRLHVPPILYDWGGNLGRAAILTPVALAGPTRMRDEWRARGGSAVAIGLLSPAAYILVLGALRLAPVSYVAPAREISILITALVGARLLGERDAPRRLAAAAAMVAGVVALAIG